MKATVISVFKNKNRIIHYHYHDVKKFSDDVEDISQRNFFPPMMEIKLWKEKYDPMTESGVEFESIKTFATPQIIKKYTGFDLFDASYFYYIDGKLLDIEFEWYEGEYPYIRTYHSRDFISTEKYKIPRITNIEEPKFDW